VSKNIVFIILFSFTLVVYSEDIDNIGTGIFLPHDAKKIEKEILGLKDGYRSRPIRYNFELLRKYPNTQVIESYKRQLDPRGWVLCVSKSTQKINKTWESLSQKLKDNNLQAIRQKFNYFVNSEKNEILSIRLHYIGTFRDGENKGSILWDDDKQYINITHYKLDSNKYKSIMLFYLDIGLVCTK
jgi:hypothetical protein